MERQPLVNILVLAQYGGVLQQDRFPSSCLTFRPYQLAHSTCRLLPRRRMVRRTQTQEMELQLWSTSPCSWNNSSKCNINTGCKGWLLITTPNHLAGPRLSRTMYDRFPHLIFINSVDFFGNVVIVSRGLHCTKHVRVYVSAQKGY
jgi:hypothetical protein